MGNPNGGKILVMDKKGRVTLPERVHSLIPLWKDNKLYLVKNDFLKNATIEKSAKILKDIEKYRVKGLPYCIPRTYEPTNRITIPVAVRVSSLWKLEKTVFHFENAGVKVPAYVLIPLKVVPLSGGDNDDGN